MFTGNTAGIGDFKAQTRTAVITTSRKKLLQAWSVEADDCLTIHDDDGHTHLSRKRYHLFGGGTVAGHIMLGILHTELAKKALGLMAVTSGRCGVNLNVH